MTESVGRVLLLTHELSFRGSSVLTLRLAQGLESRGIETVVLCTRRRALDSELLKGVRIATVAGYTIPIWQRIVRLTVFNELREHRPDLIHVHGPKMLTQGLWLGKALECPVVLSLTDQGEAARVSLPAERSVCRAIVCVSDSVRQALPPRLEQTERRVILPGVPLDLSRTVPQVLQLGRAPVIGMAGPLEVIKGGSFFLRACHRVIEAGINIRIVVAGSGPEERNLRRLATSLELDDFVTFVDDGTAMSAYLSAVDIFCLPSLQQGFGVIMLEAMALGRPVIASAVGGILSILTDEKTGLVVPPSDSRALADRLLDLLRDPEKARRIAVAGQNLVEDQFTVERMVSDMQNLYGDVVDSGTPSAAAIPLPSAGNGTR